MNIVWILVYIVVVGKEPMAINAMVQELHLQICMNALLLEKA